MKIRLKHFGGMNFEAINASGQRVVMSASPDLGGEDLGARPMEMVLMGLGGCSGIDILLILKKSRQQVTACEIEIEAKRAESIPAVFTEIHAHFTISGVQLNHEKVARAISLSMQKYCSVTRMLEKSASITHGFDIVETPA